MYVHVVTVEMQEVGRYESNEDACREFITTMKRRIHEGMAGPSLPACWIEAYLFSNEEERKAVLASQQRIPVRPVGIAFLRDIVDEAYRNGWMRDGEWVARVSRAQSGTASVG